jgi:hypothetical protein
MPQTLLLHPDSSCFAVTNIEAEVARPRARTLVFTYAVTGKISKLAVPPLAAPAQTDELWRHTCFEAFLASSPDAAYYEFNFAPSTQWAAYRFSGYRTGMRAATEIKRPQISVESSPERYVLQASVELDQVLLSRGAVWRLGVSAVIKEKSGSLSYWALAHPPGKADFHHSDCFALELV